MTNEEVRKSVEALSGGLTFFGGTQEEFLDSNPNTKTPYMLLTEDGIDLYEFKDYGDHGSKWTIVNTIELEPYNLPQPIKTTNVLDDREIIPSDLELENKRLKLESKHLKEKLDLAHRLQKYSEKQDKTYHGFLKVSIGVQFLLMFIWLTLMIVWAVK